MSYRETFWERHPGIAALFGLLAVVLIGAGCWLGSVLLSDPVGAGNTEIKNNSVENRVGAQERIRSLYEAVQRNETIAKDAAALSAKRPDNKQYEMDATGARQVCVTSVHEYNAETHKILSQDWKDKDLPWELDDAACRFQFDANGNYIQG